MAILEEHQFTFGSGKKTFYVAAGPEQGPLLIFIHGWPAIGKLWKPQLETFSSLGFRVVAPDMPGYGKSTATRNTEDYSQENINSGMVALLEHLGSSEAVWIGMSSCPLGIVYGAILTSLTGHDWGCGSVWSFAAHYPEKCTAVAALTVPYRTLEMGLEELMKFVNRDIYPKDEYPHGQWSYQNFYEQSFDKATAWFDQDPASVLRLLYSKGNPDGYDKPAITANVTKDGSWFGGVANPDPKWKQLPIEKTVLDEDMFAELTAAMEKTGFWGADAWYMNHQRNREYALKKSKNDGYLHMPTLFIGARFDAVTGTVVSRICEPMRKYCTDLTETVVDAGHWVAEEKPQEVSAAIARWLVENCKHSWPGYWSNAFAKTKL